MQLSDVMVFLGTFDGMVVLDVFLKVLVLLCDLECGN